MARYRSKVVEIDAFRFGEESFPDWFSDAVTAGPVVLDSDGAHPMSKTMPCAYIKTLEGVMTARPGDWIIRGLEGELYPCKDSVFRAKYERVEN